MLYWVCGLETASPVTITFTGALGDRRTAVQRSGTLEGGGAVTFDVGESEMGALAALMPLARIPLRITVEVDTETAALEERTADTEESKPAWAGQLRTRKQRG